MFATFGGALLGAFIAGRYTMKAVENDLEDRKKTAKIEKEEEKLNKIKQLKAVLLFEMDNLLMFNHTIAHNLLPKKDLQRISFLKSLVLYDVKNDEVNLTLKEMERLKKLITYHELNESDSEEKIKLKFNEAQKEDDNIKISKKKAKVIKDFLENFKYLDEACLNVNVRYVKQLEEFNGKIQDVSSLLFILNKDEINILYGIKQLIKSIKEDVQISETGNRRVGIYKVDRNFFLLNILISELNYMSQSEINNS